MEYAKKCLDCEYRRTAFCYGMRRYQRTGICHVQFQKTRRQWIKNLPTSDQIGESIPKHQP